MLKITVSHDSSIDRWTVVRAPLEGENEPSTLSLHTDKGDAETRGRAEAKRLHEDRGAPVEFVVKNADGKIGKNGRKTIGKTKSPRTSK